MHAHKYIWHMQLAHEEYTLHKTSLMAFKVNLKMSAGSHIVH